MECGSLLPPCKRLPFERIHLKAQACLRTPKETGNYDLIMAELVNDPGE